MNIPTNYVSVAMMVGLFGFVLIVAIQFSKKKPSVPLMIIDAILCVIMAILNTIDGSLFFTITFTALACYKVVKIYKVLETQSS